MWEAGCSRLGASRSSVGLILTMVEGVTWSLLVWGLGWGHTRISDGARLSPGSGRCMDPVRVIFDSSWLGPDSLQSGFWVALIF